MEKSDDNLDGRKNSRLLIKIVWTITTLIILTVVILFIFNFHKQQLSNSTEQWGQTGDYFGGILNPIISLINLAVLTYISFAVVRIENQRNKWTLQELARPLGQIICLDKEQQIQVTFKNCGLGPLTIKKIIVKSKEGTVEKNLIKLMPTPPEGCGFSNFIIDGTNFTVAKDDEIELLVLLGQEETPIFQQFRMEVRRALHNLTVEIHYQDIYDRDMKPAMTNLELFGRMLGIANGTIGVAKK